MIAAALFTLSVAAPAIPPVAAAEAPTRSAETVLMAESPRGREFQEKLGYSDAVLAGDLIFLSGIVAGTRPGEEGLEPAYERAYRQAAAILARAGASWNDVVDLTSFHTDVEAQIEPLAAVHKRHVKAPYPAWTAIGVSRLLGGGITEIKITARRRAVPAAARR